MMTKAEKAIDRADEHDQGVFANTVNCMNDPSYWEDVYEDAMGISGPRSEMNVIAVCKKKRRASLARGGPFFWRGTMRDCSQQEAV